MGMNTKVQGRLPRPQCITLHLPPLFEVVVLKSYMTMRQQGITRITFEVTQIKEGIGSTHQGILGTYTTSFKSKYHQLESRAWLTKGEDTIYQRHYVSEKELTR